MMRLISDQVKVQPSSTTMSSDSTSRPKSSSALPLRISLPPVHDNQLGGDVYDSPIDSNDTEDTLSDSTFDDEERLSFGYPLERMPRHASIQFYSVDQQINTLLKQSPCSSANPSRSGSFSSTSYDLIDYDQVIEQMLHQTPSPFLLRDSRNMVAFDSTPIPKLCSIPEAGPRLMIKRLPRSSPELLLLLELSHPDSRADPWNPVPHIMSAVERVDQVYLCLQDLAEFNKPPLQDVAQHIDFFRQILEGLTFLHEQGVVGLSCSDPSTFMVDLSSAPHFSSSTQAESSSSFDRFTYPVRYYFVNYSAACRIPSESISSADTLKAESTRDSPFRKDMRECGALFERLLLEVPQIAQKFKSLTRGMMHGNFKADNSRRLFEALCHSLDATVFESQVPPRPRKPERAHTMSHPCPLSSKFLQLEKVSSH